jgi:hypothetical protein
MMQLKTSPTGKRLAGPILASHLPRLGVPPVKARKSWRWWMVLNWVIAFQFALMGELR